MPRARLNYEYEGTPVYLVMKHRDSTKLDELNAVGDEIERVFSTEGFYIHRNSNNIASVTLPGRKRAGRFMVAGETASGARGFPGDGAG